MAYRKPGVTVTQEFAAAAPALAAAALPCVVVGPAYQLVDSDELGDYTGSAAAFRLRELLGGAIVDLEKMADDERFPDTKKPIKVKMNNTYVEVLASKATGAAVATAFTDATTGQFAGVAPGDVVTIVANAAATIVSAKTDGASVATDGQKSRLFPGTGTSFASVKVGDTVEVTAGTNTAIGTYTVAAKAATYLTLSGATDLNDGEGASSNISYSIVGSRGAASAGDYAVKTVSGENALVLLRAVPVSEAPLTYKIKRSLGTVDLERVDSASENGFYAHGNSVSLPADLVYLTRKVVSGKLNAEYRALRIDLASEVKNFTSIGSLNAVFGTSQITPQNPLAYGLAFMLQNTVTPVNALGLDGNAVADEALSYVAATDVLKRSDMYAIALLTQNPVVHTLFKNHVEQLSQPDKKLERVVIINSALHTRLVLQDELTTVDTVAQSRLIVETLTDGAAASTAKSTLLDATAPFSAVKPGDIVVILGGSNVIEGSYTIDSVTDEETIVLTIDFASGDTSDVQYYIYRKDGLAADGLSLYDRNAEFLTNGVASGHFLSILSGDYAGRYRIATVESDNELTLLPAVLGVTSLVTEVSYQIDRDLQKTEQSDAVKGYSNSFASRRVVHVWPDVLETPLGQRIIKLPGFYATCAIAALTTGLPTQQGFTNLAISGFLGFEHSTRYFTEDELDNIADGGTMILAQEGPQQPLYVRHQLTTDRSSVKFQEFSVTKNVDFIAKFLRTTYSRFIGQYNIVDTTLDALRLTATAAVKFLKDRRVAKFGGVIRSGSMKSLVESTTQLDTVEMAFSFSIPIPLNHIDITIAV